MGQEKKRCAKRGSTQMCTAEKCYTYRCYSREDLPCFYEQSKDCGFDGELIHVSGVKIRRQYFTYFVIGQMLAVYMVYLALILNTLTSEKGPRFNTFGSMFDPLITLFFFMVPFLILGLMNVHLFGRCVCVLNENGIYSNQPFIRWTEIESIEYFAKQPHGRTFRNCYAKVSGGGREIILAHAPHLLLLRAKKYNPEIRTFFSRESKEIFWLWVLVVPAVVIVMHFVK